MRAARPTGTATAGARRWSPRRHAARLLVASAVALAASACASKPPPAVAPPPPPTYEQKIAAILHLEDRRTLTDATLAPAAVGALPALSPTAKAACGAAPRWPSAAPV